MDEFIYEVEVDICARTFKLKSDKGVDKVIACENIDEFMRVLEVCDQMLEPCMIEELLTRIDHHIMHFAIL